MARGIERRLGVNRFNVINLIYWTTAVSIISVGIVEVLASATFFDQKTGVIVLIISPWFSFWALGYLAAQVLAYINDLTKTHKYLVLSSTGIAFGIIHTMLTPIVSLLLVRLLTTQKAKWSEVYQNPLQQPQYILVASILFILFFILLDFLGKYRRLVEQNQRSSTLVDELGSAQLKSLKMQMRPHFLFNALNTISMMIREEKKNEATDMVANLSEMLRASLKESDKEFSTLTDEIKLINNLLAIEKYRFDDRLTVEVKVAEDTGDCLIPTLILQPIVENAFKHGVSKTIGKALVSVNCYLEDNNLILEVYNTGPNLPENWELQKFQNIGLANTSSRLVRIYGSDSKLIIEEKNEGILVTIKIPDSK